MWKYFNHYIIDYVTKDEIVEYIHDLEDKILKDVNYIKFIVFKHMFL